MLYGEKVRLRALESTDIERMQRWVNELDGLVSSLTIPHLRNRKELEKSIDQRENGSQYMAIETTDGRNIGLLQIHGIDWVHRHAEVTLMIGEPDYRGRGFEEDALRVAAGYAFRVLNMQRLGASLVGENERLKKVYETAGFKVEGRRDDFYWAGDRYLDQVLLRMLAHEFRKPQSVQANAG